MKIFGFRGMIVSLAVFTLLGGCAAPTQQMTDADRKAIQAVAVSPEVAKPAEIYYLGPDGAAGLSFGLIGALATEDIRKAGRQRFTEDLQKAGVRIEDIVRSEVRQAILDSRKIAIADKQGPGVAIVKITILQYGFSVPNAISSNLVPILYVQCEMVDGGGRVIWSASDRVLTLGNPADSVPDTQLRNDPKLIEQQWRTAARAIAANIFKEL